MTGLKDIVDLLVDWAAQAGVKVSPPSWWPNTPTLVAVLLVLGILLALWGSRLLRLIYVLTFIVIGGALGVAVAKTVEKVDLLIGLVIGAGLAGLAGHLLFRWWVGMTAACCAALLVLAVAAARNSQELVVAMKEYHQQQRIVVVPAQPAESPPVSDGPASQTSVAGQAAWALKAYLADAFSYFRQTRQDVVAKVVIVAVLAWITGLGMGLALPRFTTILGTACIGVAMISLGLGMLLATYSPATLDSAAGKERYVAIGLGVLLLISLIVQARHRRLAPQPSAPPAPAPKAV